VALTIFFSTMGLASQAFGHFIWIVIEDGVAKIYFSDGLEPDEARLLDGLSGLKVFVARTEPNQSLPTTRRTDGSLGWFETAVFRVEPIYFSCEYGLFTRGEKKMRLTYFGKYAHSSMSPDQLGPQDRLKLDLVPEWKDGKLTVRAFFDGQSAEGVEISCEHEGASERVTLTTDATGAVEFPLANPSRVSLLGKKAVGEPGELDGKPYEEHRFYCTMVYDIEAKAKEGEPSDRDLPTDDRANRLPDTFSISSAASGFRGRPCPSIHR
jgi:hypothetical protein